MQGRRVIPFLPLGLGINKIGEVIGNYNFYIKPFFKFFFRYCLKNFNFIINNLYRGLNIGYLFGINFIL